MSLIPELGKDLENLPDILGKYEDALNGYEDNLQIEGKNLEKANREQASWQSYYDQRKIELYALVKYFEARIAKVRGTYFKGYTENYSRELTDRAKDKYIDHEEGYLKEYEIYLEVKELYDRYDSVVESFKARGYALNNITKIRVASLEDVIV